MRELLILKKKKHTLGSNISTRGLFSKANCFGGEQGEGFTRTVLERTKINTFEEKFLHFKVYFLSPGRHDKWIITSTDGIAILV